MTINGKSILLVLFIIIISSALISLLILVKEFNNKSEGLLVKNISHNISIESIATYYSENYPAEFTASTSINNLAINIKKWYYGLLNYTNCQSITGIDTLSFSICNAQYTDNKSIIELRNSPHELSLFGKSYLVGDIYSPGGTLKKKILNNITTDYTHLGKLSTPKEFPQLNKTIQKKFIQLLKSNNELFKSSLHMQSLNIINSFSNETLVLDETSLYKQSVIAGNVFIVSEDTLYVDNNTKLEGVVLIAPVIIIASGFIGTGQFLAKNELDIGSNSTFNYPSVLAVPNTGNINIGNNVTLNGNIYSFFIYNDEPILDITINNGFQLNGIIYTIGGINIKKAVINGALYAYSLNSTNENNTDQNSIGDLIISYKSKEKSQPIFNHFEDKKPLILRKYNL